MENLRLFFKQLTGNRLVGLAIAGAIIVVGLVGWGYRKGEEIARDGAGSGFGEIINAPKVLEGEEARLSLDAGGEGEMEVRMDPTQPVQAVELWLTYDPEQTQVDDVLLGDGFRDLVFKEIYNETGSLRAVVTVGKGGEAVSSESVLARIVFAGEETFRISEGTKVASFGKVLPIRML